MMQLLDSQCFRKLARSALAALLFVWAALPNAAAYCATCYSVAGIGEKITGVLQRGIAVLLVPTVAIMGLIVWLTLRSKDASSQESPDPSPEPSVPDPYSLAPPLSDRRPV